MHREPRTRRIVLDPDPDDCRPLLPSTYARHACCFVAGTLVHTPSGPVPIQHLMDRMAVFGRPDAATGDPAAHAIAGRVFGQTRTLYHVTVEGGHRVASTRAHPYYVLGVGWKHAHTLGPGDRLATLEGNAVEITAVEHQQLDRWYLTYNVHVAEAATYYVSAEGGPALWVHNADPIGGRRAAQPLRP